MPRSEEFTELENALAGIERDLTLCGVQALTEAADGLEKLRPELAVALATSGPETSIPMRFSRLRTLSAQAAEFHRGWLDCIASQSCGYTAYGTPGDLPTVNAGVEA